LNGIDVQYEDKFRNWGVKVPRIESELLNTALGAKGDFAVRGNLSFRLRERTMTMSPFETVMTFDGSNVALEQARLSSTEIEAFLSGDIKRVLDSPSLDLALKGSINPRQGDQVGAAPARAGDRHGDDRRIDHRPGARLLDRPCRAQQHGRRRTRARVECRRTREGHVCDVFGT
jgi:hypothetical protein